MPRKEDGKEEGPGPTPPSFLFFDPRSLAACRIIIGLTVMIETTWTYDYYSAKAFLSDEGMYPRSIAMDISSNTPSLLYLAGSMVWVVIHQALVFCSGVAVVLGWRTKTSSLAACILWLSMLNRCYVSQHSFDDVVVFLMLLGALGLPWAECCSLDAMASQSGIDTSKSSGGTSVAATRNGHNATTKAKKEESLDNQDADSQEPLAQKAVSSSAGGNAWYDIPTFFTEESVRQIVSFSLWQIMSAIYFLAAWQKTDEVWHTGDALPLALATPHLWYRGSKFNATLLEIPFVHKLLKFVGAHVLKLEYASAVVLSLPLHFHIGGSDWIGRCGRILRTLIIVKLLGMHVSIAFFMNLSVGHINVATCAAFLPGDVWERAARIPGVTALIKHIKHAATQLIDAMKDDERHESYRLKKTTHDDDTQLSLGKLAVEARGVCAILVAVMFARMVGENVDPFVDAYNELVPQAIDDGLDGVANLFHINQAFNVFSPRPPEKGFWLSFPGILRDGLEVDVVGVMTNNLHPPFPAIEPYKILNRAAHDEQCAAAPAHAPIVVPVGRQFTFDDNQDRSKGPVNWGMKGSRWQKYFELVVENWNDYKDKNDSDKDEKGSDKDEKASELEKWYVVRDEKLKLRLGVARWVCRTWNTVHGDTPYELHAVEIVFYAYDLKKKVTPPWTADDVIGEKLFRHECSKRYDEFDDLLDGEKYKNATVTNSKEEDTRSAEAKDKVTVA